MARAQLEFKLQCVIVDYLRYALPPRAIWTAFPAGEARSVLTGVRLKRAGLACGWPDIIVLSDGLFLGIELKTPCGELSDAQALVGDGIVANGGKFFVCRSLDDVVSALGSAGVPLRARP